MLFLALLAHEEACDKIDKKDLLDILKICGVRGRPPEGLYFYTDASASVCVQMWRQVRVFLFVWVRDACVVSLRVLIQTLHTLNNWASTRGYYSIIFVLE